MKITFESRFLAQIIYQLEEYTKYHLNGTRMHFFLVYILQNVIMFFALLLKIGFYLSILFFFLTFLHFTKLHHFKLLLFQFRTHIQPYFVSSGTRGVEHFPTALQLINSLFNSATFFDYYLDPAVFIPG